MLVFSMVWRGHLLSLILYDIFILRSSNFIIFRPGKAVAVLEYIF